MGGGGGGGGAGDAGLTPPPPIPGRSLTGQCSHLLMDSPGPRLTVCFDPRTQYGPVTTPYSSGPINTPSGHCAATHHIINYPRGIELCVMTTYPSVL